MNINIILISKSYRILSSKKSILPSFTAQQKKIIVIASIALSILAALYASGCCRY